MLPLCFTLGWLAMYRFRPESQQAALPLYGASERFWVRLTPAIFSTHVTLACLTISRSPAIPPGLTLLSLSTFAAAVGFWFWGRLQISPLNMQRLPDDPPLRFRVDGAFGIVRHPTYLAYVVAAAAPVLAVPRCFLVVTFAFCAAAVGVRAVQEERRLLTQVGVAYERYRRVVKRLIPFIW